MALITKFGVYTLDVSAGELSKRGIRIKLQDQPFRMLCLLVQRRSELVTREELRAEVWPETFVDFDLALNTAVRKIRRALGDSAENPRFIETIPKRGYRFIAPIEDVTPEPLSGSPIEPVLPLSPVSRLSWLAGGLGLVLLAGILAWASIHRFAPARFIDSLAVLPFVNVSGDPELEFLGDGLAESLIGTLSELRSLRVMSLGTTLTYKGHPVDPRAIGRDLKVSGVLQGKIERHGEMLAVEADLTDAVNGTELWRGHYQRPAIDALDLEQEIARDVVRKLIQSPNGEVAARLSGRSTQNREAYQHYLKGLYDWRQLSSVTASQALEQFEKSIALDPNYALPYVGIANTYQVLNDWVVPPREAVARTRAAARKALDLNATLDEAHTMMGAVRFWYDFDQAGAENEFRRAIELNPGSDDAHAFYSWYLVSNKRFDEGLAESRRALELSPLDLNNQVVLAQNLYYCHRYDEALEEIRAMVAQNPNAWVGHEFLGWVYEVRGELGAAIEELKIAVKLEPNIAEPLASLGRAFAMNGNLAAARQVLAQLNAMSAHSHVPPYDLALLYMALSDRERAIRQLQMAYDERSWFLTFLSLDPRFDTVRSDHRVQEILRKIGLL